MEKEEGSIEYIFNKKDDITSNALSELFTFKIPMIDNKDDYCILNGTLIIPSEKKFAESGFQRSDIIMLIDILKILLDVHMDGLHKDFSETVNHFARNGALSALTGDDEKKKNAYWIFTELIKTIINMDDAQRLYFLKRLEDINMLEKKGQYKRKEGYNLIDVMYDEGQKVLSEAKIDIKNIEDQKKNQ